MAKAKITCKCEICGGTFEHVRTCANSSAAASYEEWAAEHVTVCPSCYAAAKKAEAKAKLDAYRASASQDQRRFRKADFLCRGPARRIHLS